MAKELLLGKNGGNPHFSDWKHPKWLQQFQAVNIYTYKHRFSKYALCTHIWEVNYNLITVLLKFFDLFLEHTVYFCRIKLHLPITKKLSL